MYQAIEETILNELTLALSRVSPDEIEALATLIEGSKRIFVAGAGRSGLMCKAFAMRLMHLGMEAHAVGDSTTPSLNGSDLLIVFSGSGETGSLVAMSKKARGLDAKLALVTISAASTIAQLADVIVCIQAPTPKISNSTHVNSIQPMGSLFEQSLLILSDAIVLILMKRLKETSETMFSRHANLE